MGFKKNDNSFICLNCGANVDKLGKTSRNHCTKCLWSLHVDNDPGDRLNECKGLMQPIGIEYNANKGYVIVHKCTKCGMIKKNKTANDDDFNKKITFHSLKCYFFKWMSNIIKGRGSPARVPVLLRGGDTATPICVIANGLPRYASLKPLGKLLPYFLKLGNLISFVNLIITCSLLNVVPALKEFKTSAI